jgi:HD-like signal output (HDOD) protein
MSPVLFQQAVFLAQLIFASVEGAAYTRFLSQANSDGFALEQAEEGAWNMTHASVGACLLNRWSLPESVVLAVLHHHHSLQMAAPCQRPAATERQTIDSRFP